MEKIKLKCCPFCGCDQMTIQHFHSYGHRVECDQCYASGPFVNDSDLMDGFIEDASDEEIAEALKELAATRWNCRPPMTDLYTDDFAAFEQFGETTESL